MQSSLNKCNRDMVGVSFSLISLLSLMPSHPPSPPHTFPYHPSSLLASNKLQGLMQFYSVVLGLEVLGNPVGFLRGVAEGTKGIFYHPIEVEMLPFASL